MNKWLSEFPATQAGHAVTLLLILLFGIMTIVLLGREKPFPTGYDAFMVFLASLAGVSTAGMIGKRLTDIDYKAAGAPAITVEAPSTVTVAAPAAGGVAAPSAPAPPDPDKDDK